MDRPHPLPAARALQWTATPSEEQLLGSPLMSMSSPPAVSFEPPPPHDWAATADVPPPHEPPTTARRAWRPQARDLIALAAVAAAVWFAVRGAEGVPFRSVEGTAPTAADGVTALVIADRQELQSLPHVAATTTAGGATAGQGQKQGTKHDRGSPGSGGGGKEEDDPPATGGDSKDPLLQATVPGVGSVTVEQPDVPETGLPLPEVPDLPGAEVAVPGTITVSLP